VLTLVCIAIQLFMLVLFIAIILSWAVAYIPPTPGGVYAQAHEVFQRVTEPVLAPVRAMLPPVRMGPTALDLSPIVVFLVLILLRRAIC
jgi:YggT family protein